MRSDNNFDQVHWPKIKIPNQKVQRLSPLTVFEQINIKNCDLRSHGYVEYLRSTLANA